MMLLGRVTAVLALGVVLTSGSLVRAAESSSIAKARRLYSEAKNAFKKRKYEDAARGFEAASRLHPAAVALYTAAQAWEFAGRPALAADDYARALSIPKLSDSQSHRAQERLDKLEKRLGTIEVHGKPDGHAQVDDHSAFPLPARLHGAPGQHTVTVTESNGKTRQQVVTLAAGQKITMEARASKPAEPAEPEPAQSKPPERALEPVTPAREAEREPGHSSLVETVGFVSAGVGVGAVAGGLVLGLAAKDSASTYDTTPSRATYDHAKGLQTKTNIMLIAGGALTAVGVGLVIWQATKHDERSASVELKALPSAIWAEGRF